jgi:hypothetical protein
LVLFQPLALELLQPLALELLQQLALLESARPLSQT